MPVDSKRVQSVFLAAVAVDPPARAAVLDRECGPDADLRQRVEALLRAHDEPGTFLASPAAAPGVTVDSQPGQDGGNPAGPQVPAETPGTHLGPYKLLQMIGEGGMGTVWMAEQTESVRRLVALKVIRAGLDSAQAVARFEAERQALALMDHPNIARVLDAGTTAAGRPYFVMELVKGTPITKYCDEHRLTPRQRLELFVPVCQALQHAHQKGIIHRDVKPSNVLVAPYDGKPVVKVIDFGVAKATGQRLTERTMFTEFGAVIGTLEYMSPEQAELNNQDIDTRSDIYSLGVLLYELLTGTTPLDRARLKQAAFTELLRLIREEEPPRPSARLSASREALPSISAQRQTEPARLAQLVRGELDWIVMRALEKDRSRRYDTANGLARDVERYLHEEPVEACPPSAAYRLRKFLHRNKGPVAAAAVMVLALLGGIAGTTWGLVRASQALHAEAQERAVAERERDDKEQARKTAEEQRSEAARARDQAETALYFNRVNLAHQDWLANNLTQSRRILDACPEGRRGWEWRYLDHLHHADLLTLPGIGGQFRAQFSKHGKRLALIADLGETRVRTWDATANRPLAEISLLQRQPSFSCAALSPDGRTVALGDRAGVVGLYDADTGRLTRELARLSRWVGSLSFSPDGRWLAAARADGRNGEMLLPLAEPPRNEDLVVWEVASGKEVFHPKGYGFTAEFSPDGSRLLTFKLNTALRLTPTGPETFVALFDTAGWTEVTAGKLGTARSFSFSGDGKRLALGGVDRQRNTLFVRVVDPATGDELLTLTPRAVGDVALSPDGATLAVTEGLGSTQIDVWDLKARRQVRTLRGHTNTVNAVAFAPDGRLASCSWDNTIKFWDPAADQEVRPLARPSVGQASPAVFGPGGALLAFGQEGTVSLLSGSVSSITLLDAKTGGVTGTLAGRQGAPVGLAFSGDGSRLASGDRFGDVKVWDAATGAEIRTHHGPGGKVTALALSADGRWVASAYEPKEVARAREVMRETGKVEASDKDVAAAIEVWDAETGRGRTALTGHPSGVALPGVTRLAFSPDGRLLASYGYPLVRVWDPAGGGVVRELELKEYLFGINVLAFGRGGGLLATGGSRKGQLWDVASGRSVALFQGHRSDRIDGLALSPDETRVATASDREVKVWDARSGQEALTLALPGSAAEKGPDVVALAWTADGQRLRAALRDASVVEWDATAKPAK